VHAGQLADEAAAYYVDEHGIEAHAYANAPQKKTNVLGQFAGFWRLYRLGTGSESQVRINQSLLNIHVQRRGVTSASGIPWFKMYFEGDRSGDAALRQAVGPVFPISERLVFLGHRLSEERPFVTSMVWPFSDPESSEIRHRQKSGGLAYLSNSHGDQIASYTIAKFVPQTEAMDDAAFKAAKDQETQRVRSYAPEELANELAPAEIEELVSRSKKLVFSIRDV
jgi:hypothetical protein